MTLYSLVVIITIWSGHSDGGVAVQTRNLGQFTKASCEAAAKDIEARNNYTHWSAYGSRSGSTITRAHCLAIS